MDLLLCNAGNKWSFDIYEVYNLTGRDISLLGLYMFKQYDFFDALDYDESYGKKFFNALEKRYAEHSYHNSRHSADVAHSLLFFIRKSALKDHVTALEIHASLIAAFGHDTGHPGVNNRFLLNSRDELAFIYNDRTILENMH